MGKNTNTIEINGKRYDTSTGAVLDVIAPPTKTKHAPKPAHTPPLSPPATPKPRPIDVHVAGKPKTHRHNDIKRRPAKKIASHAPQHAHTLMRKSVTKPEGSFKRQVKAHGSTDALMKTTATIAPKRSIGVLDQKRADHAKRVAKSAAVKRFHHSTGPSVIPVTVTKQTTTAHHQAAPSAPHAATKASSRPPHANHAPVHKAETTADLLERALQQATSHLEPAPKLPKKGRLSKRASNFAAVLAALVILAGFAALQNLPVMRVKLASSKAGFSANLPGYKPAGYHLSKLNSAPGKVSLNFTSNSDERSFAITEKSSSWDSSTLRDTYLADSGQNYQTMESAGRTLYIYGKNAATWVSGGVWYQVETNGSLSTRQLLDLASSL